MTVNDRDEFQISVSEKVLAATRGDLLRFARRLVGPADAEDVVQEAWMRAWRASLRPGADPAPWLTRIAHNVAVDVLRGRARAAVAVVPGTPAAGSAEAEVLASEASPELAAALARLSDDQRRAVLLHDSAGYSSHEIAALEGVAYHTIRTRLFRGRRALRSALQAKAA